MNEASVELVQKNIKEKVKLSDILYSFIKRSFDIIMSLTTLILLSPLFLIIAFLIRFRRKDNI